MVFVVVNKISSRHAAAKESHLELLLTNDVVHLNPVADKIKANVDIREAKEI